MTPALMKVSNKDDFGKKANNVSFVASGRVTGDFSNSFATLEQKDAQSYQYAFIADNFDIAEFGTDLKDHERLIRLSTPLSDPDNDLHRTIAKLSLKTGAIAFLDNEAYEHGEYKWERPTKCKFICADTSIAYFFRVWHE